MRHIAHIWTSYRRPSARTPILSDLNDPASQSAPAGDARYSLTKLASVFLARQLARLPAAEGTIINAIHPGLCVSEFRRDMAGLVGWAIDRVAWPARKGARGVRSSGLAPSGRHVRCDG